MGLPITIAVAPFLKASDGDKTLFWSCFFLSSLIPGVIISIPLQIFFKYLVFYNEVCTTHFGTEDRCAVVQCM